MTIRAASLALSLLLSVALATPAAANAFDRLVAKGYKVSKMTQGKSGSTGWYLTKAGEQRMFCRANVGVVRNGKGFVAFTSAGQIISLHTETYVQGLKGKIHDMPQLRVLKAGKIDGRWVGPCSRM